MSPVAVGRFGVFTLISYYFLLPFFKSWELNKWVSRRKRDVEYVPRYHENDKAPVMVGWQQFTGSTASGQDPSERNSQHPHARSLGVRPQSALPTFVYSRGSIVAPVSTSPPVRKEETGSLLKLGSLELRTTLIPTFIISKAVVRMCVCVCWCACQFSYGQQLCKG